MRYKLKILTRAKTHTYILKDIPMYEWDNVLGFDVERDELISKLNDLQTLKEITKLMISRGFFRWILWNPKQREKIFWAL